MSPTKDKVLELAESIRTKFGITETVPPMADWYIAFAAAIEAECRKELAGAQAEIVRKIGQMNALANYFIYLATNGEGGSKPPENYLEALVPMLAASPTQALDEYVEQYVAKCGQDVLKTPIIKEFIDASIAKAVEPYKQKYEELLYAVSQKYPNETRHETALRYIRYCEEPKCGVSVKAVRARKEKP